MRRNLKLSLSGFLSYVSFFLVFVILNLRILSLSTHISLVMCQIGSLVVESHIFLNLKKIIFFTNLQSHSFFSCQIIDLRSDPSDSQKSLNLQNTQWHDA